VQDRFWVVVAVAACAPRGDPPATVGGYARAPTTAVAAPEHGATVVPPAVQPARSPMTVVEARRFMVVLVNRDRASQGLPPVELDDGAPTRAGQSHADDMATHGYLGHFGTDGSVPEQRFTQAGGADMVLENASCFSDERERVLDRSPRIDPGYIEQAEDMFFHEQPPHDGHRKNILKASHKKVGIGIAQPVGTASEIPVPCFAQEFVDPYGAYAPVPRTLRVGSTLHVEGTVDPPAVFSGVGMARVDWPQALPVAELNRRRSYAVPTPYQTYWPAGYQTPIPVAVNGHHFRIDFPVSDGGKPGMYELSIWAVLPGSSDLMMISLRTLQAR
jgi:uncharacterized protein YkwD